MIEGSGYCHNLPMREYLADPCVEPSLSSKIVGLLVRSTPQRARMAHPQFNTAMRDFSPRADIGSAVHALAHGGYPLRYVESVTKRSGKEAGVPFVPTDWMTQDAKDARDAIRREGGIPLLPADRLGVEAASAAVTMALAELGTGKHEQTLLFQFEGVWCRGRADWLSDGAVQLGLFEAPDGVDVDTKTVQEANGVTWLKQVPFSGDLVFQMALRHLGHIALTGKARKMVWLLAEIEAPYDTCFVECTEEIIEYGVRAVRHAAKLWRRCLDEQRWPGNKREVLRATLPAWASYEMESRGIE